MKQILLGDSPIVVSVMGMGCWAIGGPFFDGKTPLGWGKTEDKESILALQAAYDSGITFYDTADVYGAGHSERLLGKVFVDKREHIVIASKFGNLFDERTKQVTGSDVSRIAILDACDASLTRLQTDHIDLYQLHINDYPLEKADEVLETLERLVEKGKILAYGWSTDDVERARYFAKGEHNCIVQFQMNVLADAPAMVKHCNTKNVAGIIRGPLAMGLLGGKYSSSTNVADDDVRGAQAPEWMHFFQNGKPNPALLNRLDAVRGILTADGRTLAQGALAWIWARSKHVVPIPGIRLQQQAEENAKAAQFGALHAEAIAEISQLLDSAT